MLSSKLCSWMFSLMEYSLLMVNIITLLNYAQSLQSRKWCPGNEWGGSQPQEGSTELCVPQGSQMHLQQIWTLRHNWEVWWPLHSLTQHNQWKGKNILDLPSSISSFSQIYVLLWFWFVFLSTVSAFQLIWRVLSITSRRTREFILRRQTLEYAQVKQQLILV